MFTYDHKNISNACSATKREIFTASGGEDEVTFGLDFCYFLLTENNLQFFLPDFIN
jgi:hypothetical protein